MWKLTQREVAWRQVLCTRRALNWTAETVREPCPRLVGQLAPRVGGAVGEEMIWGPLEIGWVDVLCCFTCSFLRRETCDMGDKRTTREMTRPRPRIL